MNQRSYVWYFFDRQDDGVVRCRYCPRRIKFSGSTTSMKKHVDTCHEKKRDEKLKGRLETPGNPAAADKKELDQMEFQRLISLFICSWNSSFRIMKNIHFRALLFNVNPNVQIPNVDIVKTVLKNNMDNYIEEVKTCLKDAEKVYISTDGWDMNHLNSAIISFCVHWIGTNFQRESRFLEAKIIKSATAVIISEETLKVIVKFGLSRSKVMGIVCPGDAIWAQAAELLGCTHIRSFAHVAASIIKVGAESCGVKKALRKASRFAKHLENSKAERMECRARSNSLGVCGKLPTSYSRTHFGGSVILAQQFILHRKSITTPDYLPTNEEVEELEQFISATTPVLELLISDESNDSPASQTLCSFAALHNHLVNINQTQMVLQLQSQLNKHYDIASNDKLLLMASYLDPRYSLLDVLSNNEAWEEIERLVEEYAESVKVTNTAVSSDLNSKSTTGSSLLAAFMLKIGKTPTQSNAKEELDEYKALIQTIRPNHDTCPVDFWKNHAHRFPRLAASARHLLAAPQSSVQTERMFSRFRDICETPKQNRLRLDTLNTMISTVALATFQEQKIKKNKEDADEDDDDEGDDDDNEDKDEDSDDEEEEEEDEEEEEEFAMYSRC